MSAAVVETERHAIRWFGRVAPCDEFPDGFVPRTRFMRGRDWGWDVRCSCGWESRTGGAIEASVRRNVAEHRLDVEIAPAMAVDGFVLVAGRFVTAAEAERLAS